MNDVPYTNDGTVAVHVDGKRILPGETRLVSAQAAAAGGPPIESEELEGGDVLDLLDGKVETVVEVLPELTDEQLQSLLQAEQNGKTRKTMVEAISHEQLRRADPDGEGSGGQSHAGEGGDGQPGNGGEATT